MEKIAKICSQTSILKTEWIMLQIYTGIPLDYFSFLDMEIGVEKLMEVSMVLVMRFADVEW